MTDDKADIIIALLRELVALQKQAPAPSPRATPSSGGHTPLAVEIQYEPISYGGGKGYFYTGCATINNIPTRISFGVSASKYATKFKVGDVVHCNARRDSQDDKYGNPKYWFSSLIKLETADGQSPQASQAPQPLPQPQNQTLINDDQDIPF